ncbi:M24 family metallopeptidase [Tuwongella immobilis]|uniref:Peptidase M24 domain-containing protein n=1 Tax=Tuwongella immobilis TaxID=692036 RepID=A0A6C2YVD8_9BACT|nr:Xaa-Pro peptidase family protein [Tuwongella immobilis]VIP04949.1 peptidase m24 : Xaa-Pro aminopeptidase OS=Singulisphaera acidiphila (strain ATCC BAA-1392 / DSM 18658 / VKM B-2454 / MOB10) GN=Sinac_3769 PE=3 SV=1: Creatinase_N: Peptidase_M24 [Tuwongella immobilis]VTS07256.1 peptidase m24 : Xaa-Pro aminopeptidase OS=Singulisphaera acidiphila (strain ATCC BAA-1392 / DSM 18658 / VKM B-2454 / MOB10) GN=Sinac_3769 PE=3 SV=1: Creatinase_N: Peptidase_M24 [Tuwongella immobilis]
MDDLTRRRNRLVKLLKSHELDALLVTHPLNVTYLTGFTGDSSFLIVGRKQSIFVSDDRYAGQIADEIGDSMDVVIRKHDRTTMQMTAETLTQMGLNRVGVEATTMTLADYERLSDLAPTVEFLSCDALVESLRVIKDRSEIQSIRRAIDQAERAFAMFRSMMQGHESEKELADAMEGFVRRAGGVTTSFSPIVGIGDRSALPHSTSSPTRRLHESPFLLLDWGSMDGSLYRSDLTRMLPSPARANFPVATRRKIENRLCELYTIVRNAQQAAADTLRAGVEAKAVDAAARKVMEEAGYNDRFIHGLGHGVGLQIHESPSIRTNSDDILAAGMVVTLEPGIYLPEFGGVRLEDDFLITSDGCERLSHLPSDWDAYFA